VAYIAVWPPKMTVDICILPHSPLMPLSTPWTIYHVPFISGLFPVHLYIYVSVFISEDSYIAFFFFVSAKLIIDLLDTISIVCRVGNI